MAKLVFISDTHNKHDNIEIPECDILIHSGDWSMMGTEKETRTFAKWLEKQPARNIVLTAANHEVDFEDNFPKSKSWVYEECPRTTLLMHEYAEVDGIKFFGSQYTPLFGYGWAYNAGRTVIEAATAFKPFIGDLWKDIPLDTQILVTHGPGAGTLDEVLDRRTGRITNVGCSELSKRIAELKDLRISSFGHLHLNGGKTLELNGVNYINAAICDDSYNATRKPVVIENFKI